jgi:hypothetical protein
MVYPVSNTLSQQIPAANTFQPGGSVEQKRPEQDNRLDSTRTSGADTARSQKVEDRSLERSNVLASAERSEDTGGVSASNSRGTSLNITV